MRSKTTKTGLLITGLLIAALLTFGFVTQGGQTDQDSTNPTNCSSSETRANLNLKSVTRHLLDFYK